MRTALPSSVVIAAGSATSQPVHRRIQRGEQVCSLTRRVPAVRCREQLYVAHARHLRSQALCPLSARHSSARESARVLVAQAPARRALTQQRQFHAR